MPFSQINIISLELSSIGTDLPYCIIITNEMSFVCPHPHTIYNQHAQCLCPRHPVNLTMAKHGHGCFLYPLTKVPKHPVSLSQPFSLHTCQIGQRLAQLPYHQVNAVSFEQRRQTREVILCCNSNAAHMYQRH